MIVTDALFLEYVIKYKYLFYSLIKGVVVDGFSNDDLMQECLMVLNSCMKSFDDTKGISFITYLHKSIRNRMSTLISGNSDVVDFVDFSDYRLSNAVYNDNYLDKLDEDNLVSVIRASLAEMPRGHISLRYFDGESYSSIARSENITKQAVRKLHKKNVNRLKSIYK